MIEQIAGRSSTETEAKRPETSSLACNGFFLLNTFWIFINTLILIPFPVSRLLLFYVVFILHCQRSCLFSWLLRVCFLAVIKKIKCKSGVNKEYLYEKVHWFVSCWYKILHRIPVCLIPTAITHSAINYGQLNSILFLLCYLIVKINGEIKSAVSSTI